MRISDWSSDVCSFRSPLKVFADIHAMIDLGIENVVTPVCGGNAKCMGAAAHRHRGLALGRVDGELVGQVPVALLDAIGRHGVGDDLLDGDVLARPEGEVTTRYASCEEVQVHRDRASAGVGKKR